LKTDATATSSVKAIIDPNTNPFINGVWKTALMPNATKKIVTTPITEKIAKNTYSNQYTKPL